ncbi:MAG: T9SS type A sorting domain-containing protein [Saprospiraceae bacterium]
MIEGDSLIVSGEIGSDSSGLQGIFIVWSDTLGNLGKVKIFKDPKQIDQMLIDGSRPIINDTDKLVLSGEFLWKSNNYFITYNKKTGQHLYHEYNAPFIVRLTESLLEFNGAYYVIGYVQTQNFDLDVFVQKIDSLGNKIWEKTYGLPSRDETGRAAIIKNGKLTIMISESFDNTPSVKNDTRYWIRFIQIDTSGGIQNDWKEEVTGEEGWSGSLVNFNGDYIYTTNLLGEEYGSGFFQAGQVVRRDKDFKLLWRKPYGDPDNYYNGFGDLVVAPDSNLLLTGQILDESKKFVSQRILKICPDGEILWELRDTGFVLSTGESLNFMEGIAGSSCNSTYAVGYTYKSSGFYEGLILKVSGDGCIDTICTTTAIEDLFKMQKQKILLYPNPARDELNIQFSDEIPKNTFVSIYDIYGRELKSSHFYVAKNNIDLSSLPNGLYILNISDGNHLIATRKFIKQE